jgi:ABC-type uncharacterized transport system substrate-binding protein
VVGYLNNGSEEESRDEIDRLREGLAELGYVEGQNLTIDFRFMNGRSDLHPTVIEEFIKRPVDAIVAAGSTPAVAAKKATSSIPIIF